MICTKYLYQKPVKLSNSYDISLPDFNSEVQSFKTNDALTKYYTLPDGQVIDIGYECMSCVEPLFQPSELLSADVTTASQSPVHEMVNKAIKRYTN